MQQTKRRSKKGVILLALAVALLVLAFVPAAMAAPIYGAKATLDQHDSGLGRRDRTAATGSARRNITGTFNAYVDTTGGPNWVLAQRRRPGADCHLLGQR